MSIYKKMLFSLFLLSTSGLCAINTKQKMFNIGKAVINQVKTATVETAIDEWTYGPAAILFGTSLILGCLKSKLDKSLVINCLNESSALLAFSASGNFIRKLIPQDELNKLPNLLKTCLKSPITSTILTAAGYTIFTKLLYPTRNESNIDIPQHSYGRSALSECHEFNSKYK